MKNTEVFHSSLRSRLKYILPTCIYLIVDIVAVIYLTMKYGASDILLYIKLGGIAFLIIFLPTLIIHMQYYFKNKNVSLEFDYLRRTIYYRSSTEETTFSFDNIVNFIKYIHPALYEKREGWLPWERYSYVILKLDDDKKVFITCFLINQFDLSIDEEKKTVNKVFFPFIRDE